MTWKDLELMFNRALQFTFSRKKLIFMAPILISCGVLVVFCKALAICASDWVRSSLHFLPLFFCSLILVAAGVVLVRIYHDEVKGLSVSYQKTIKRSMELMVQVAYLWMPLILGYTLLWTLLGLFYLLKELPLIGELLGTILSFGPFLLLLGSFALSVVAIKMIFYLAPVVALRSVAHVQVLEDVLKRFVASPFINCALFLIALIPFSLVSGLMTVAALMTEHNYLAIDAGTAGGLNLFFIMLPFSLLLSPAVIFFFNFATESYVWVQRRFKEKIAP
jgi:hypothetical protein